MTSLHEHLSLELRRLDLLIHREILRLRAAYQLSLDEFRGLYVGDAQVDALIASGGVHPGGEPLLSDDITTLDQSARQLDAACQEGRTGELPWARLCRGLGLSALERDLVLLALAPELNAKYETLYAYLNNDVAKRAPTLHLASRLFRDGDPAAEQAGAVGLAVRAALGPRSKLLQHGLLDYASHAERHALLNTAFAIHGALPSFVLGLGFSDGDVPLARTAVSALAATPALFPARLAQRLAALGTGAHPSTDNEARPILLHGPDGAARSRAAQVLAAHAGLDLLRFDLAALSADLGQLSAAVRTAVLAQRLEPALLQVVGLERLADGEQRAAAEATVMRQLALAAGPLVLDCDQPARVAAALNGTPHVTVLIQNLDAAGRRLAWQQALDAAGLAAAPEAVARVADTFPLTLGEIARAVAECAPATPATPAALAAPEIPPLDTLVLSSAARACSDPTLAGLSQRMDRHLGWADLVLPPNIAARLREIAGALAQRQRVYGDWGFARRAGGFGVRVMLAGPSGTGKTMSVGVIANELGIDVYRVNIAQTVSKYIGETEKNLDRIFQAAASTQAILFFDEADALFGKRSEVKDAHDRYSNIEVAYLLQRIEEYEGILFLATNLSGNIDNAFSRRINFVVDFPIPDRLARARLWRAMFPQQAPVGADVDFDFLAEQFPMAGGDIHNIAIDAAFLAAQNGGLIGMKELMLSMGRQLAKQGRVPTASEFRDYLPLVGGNGT